MSYEFDYKGPIEKFLNSCEGMTGIVKAYKGYASGETNIDSLRLQLDSLRRKTPPNYNIKVRGSVVHKEIREK